MAYALYTHLMLNDSFERMAMAFISIMLLSCRLIISNQITNDVNKEIDECIHKVKNSEEIEEKKEFVIKKSTQIGSELSYSKFQRDIEEKKIK